MINYFIFNNTKVKADIFWVTEKTKVWRILNEIEEFRIYIGTKTTFKNKMFKFFYI